MLPSLRIPCLTILCGLAAALATSTPSSAQTPPFTQCPHIGQSTACAYLIVITDNGVTVLNDPSQGPYDGEDDTLIGVQNNSSSPISSLALTGGGLAIFAFDFSGICSVGISPLPPGCTPTSSESGTDNGADYEGPGTTFTGISGDQTMGTVIFNPPIPPGGHAYFGLEGDIQAASTPLNVICNPNAGPSQQSAAYSTTCTVTGGPTQDAFGRPTSPVYKWSIMGNLPSGLSLSSASGSTVTLSGSPDSLGAYSFSVQVSDNSVPTAQIARFPISGTINQLAGLCNTTLSSGGLSVGQLSTVPFSVTVNSPAGCPQWGASSPVPWINISAGATGTGVGTVSFTVQANAGASRSATLAIAGHSFVVNQLTSGCLFGVTPLKATVPSGGGNGSISIGVLNSSCSWTAVPDPNSPWLTISGLNLGTGPGAVSFVAAPNMSSIGRTGTILVAGQTFTVVQAGSVCSFSLAQAALSFTSSGGVGTATVQSPGGCIWPATSSSVPWVTINAVTGSGNGTVTYSVIPNPNLAARTGNLTIAGQPYAVVEAGSSPIICIASVASPAQVAIEGRTEVLGDLILSCGGIQGFTADVSLTLNTNVTNAITGANVTDAVLSVNGGTLINGFVTGYNTIHWPSVSLLPGNHGTTTILISKVRADASLLGAAANLQSIAVTGLVSVNAETNVPVVNALQNMATAEPALLFQQKTALAVSGGLSVPMQFQEANPTAFQAAAGTTPATRLNLILRNVPAGVQVMAPVAPNEGATAQLFSADANGNGGTAITGVALSPLTVTNGVATATWVVLAADPTQFDSYTFPVTFQNATAGTVSQIQVTGTLGPLSTVSVASPLTVAPVPRYRDFSAPLTLVNMRTTASGPPPTGSSSMSANVAHISRLIPGVVGSNGTVSNQLTNDNPTQPATDVIVRDKVTGGGTVTGCTATGGATCTTDPNDPSDAVVTIGTLAPGASVTVTVTVTPDPSLPFGSVLQSQFTTVSDQATADLSGSSASALFVVGSTGGGGGGGGAGVPANLAATGGNTQSAATGSPFAAPLQVTVTDSSGNPVGGATVTFIAPASGASATLSSTTAATNSAGVASVTATANSTAGSYSVTAIVGGLSAAFALTNMGGGGGGGGGSNLAQGKAASQSTTYPGTPAASVAVDGNTDGIFGDGSVTATNLEANPWWQVDLGSSASIANVVVWNRTDACCVSRLSDYWVFVSNTPFLASDSPATLQGRAGTFSIHLTTAPAPSTLVAVNTTGRYVRIQLNTPNYLSLAEVQVFGSGGSVSPTARQSSTLPGTPPASVAIDGIIDGNFFDGSVTATNLDQNPWWEEDLGAPTTIGSIVIWNRTDCCGSRLTDYWVFVSNTPFLDSDTPATLQNRAGTFVSHQTTAPNPSTTIPVGMQGEFVRVQLSSPGYLSLAEVQVLNGPATTNVAQGKNATQSSTYPGTPPAGVAVDGITDGSFGDGSVTATNLDANPWWQVDLGAPTSISSIVVWNRTDACCVSRLSDYWVFVSNTPFLPTDTPATLQFRAGTFVSHQTTAPTPSTVIAAVTQGQYVRIQLTNPGYLSLAEVQVFGSGGAPSKVASQSSTLPGYPTAVASSAIDGNIDGNFSDGSVTATNLDLNAWWQVDLGATTTINTVTVWNRTDCCGSRLGDYWVFVSNTPFLSTDTPASLAFRAGTFSSHQITAPNPSTGISVGIQGRYVRVQLTGTGYLSLAEVQVQ